MPASSLTEGAPTDGDLLAERTLRGGRYRASSTSAGAAPAGAVSQTASSGGPDKSVHHHYERLPRDGPKGGAPDRRAMSPTACPGPDPGTPARPLAGEHRRGRPRPERGGRGSNIAAAGASTSAAYRTTRTGVRRAPDTPSCFTRVKGRERRCKPRLGCERGKENCVPTHAANATRPLSSPRKRGPSNHRRCRRRALTLPLACLLYLTERALRRCGSFGTGIGYWVPASAGMTGGELAAAREATNWGRPKAGPRGREMTVGAFAAQIVATAAPYSGRLNALAAPLDLRAAEAAFDVVVDHPHRLHEGVDRGRADEAPAALLQVLRERDRFRRRAHCPRVARSNRSGRAFGSGSKRQKGGERAGLVDRSSARRALLMVETILPRWRMMPASPSEPLDVLVVEARPPCRNRSRRRRGGNSRVCGGWSARRGPTENPRGRSSRRGGHRRRPAGPIRAS